MSRARAESRIEDATACFLCGGATVQRDMAIPLVSFDPKATRRTIRIGECTVCGYQRNLAVRSIQDAIELQAHFDHQPGEPDVGQTRWPARAALVAHKINRFMPSGGRALDIGCNTGVNLRALGDRWVRVGVELAPALAAKARSFVPAEVHSCPVEELREPESSFDLVMSHAVIEHLYDPLFFVQCVHRLLRAGGLAVLMTGDCESRLARTMGEGWPLYVSPDHVSYFSARSLRGLLERTGFEIVSEDWRFMYFADGVGGRVRRAWMKAREIVGMSAAEQFDAYYLYARKRMPG